MNRRAPWVGWLGLLAAAHALVGAEPSDAPLWGVCGHFLHTDVFYDHYDDRWRLERTLPFLREAGMAWVREPIYALAGPRGALVGPPEAGEALDRGIADRRRVVDDYLLQYDQAGVRVMLVVFVHPLASKEGAANDERFFEWVGELVARHSCVKVVELHNEPNLRSFWKGSAADYVNTYRLGASILRRARPDLELAAPAISSLWWASGVEWMENAMDQGLLDFVDAISVHPYNTTYPPEADPHYGDRHRRDPEGLSHAVRQFWALVQRHNPKGKPLKLYFSELGYAASRKGLAAVGDEVRQADYLGRLMLLYFDLRLRGLPLEAAFWYDLKNDGADRANEQHNFGLISENLDRRKPAFFAYQRVARLLGPPGGYQPLDLFARKSVQPHAVKTLAWRRKADGALLLAVWRMDQLQEEDADFSGELALDLPEGFVPSRVLAQTLDEAGDREVPFATARDGEKPTLRLKAAFTRRPVVYEIAPSKGGVSRDRAGNRKG